MVERTLRVNEFFGPTFQGEGPFAGRVCHFLRLNRCNQHCHWCDTPYTWSHTEAKAALHDSGKVYSLEENESVWTIDQTLTVLDSNSVDFLVISGGEPLLQAPALSDLIDGLDPSITIQFETAGTLPPLDGWDVNDGVHYVVSPKLTNSGNELSLRYKPDILLAFQHKGAAFKFVVCELSDLNEVLAIQKEVGIPSEKIWIMPEGTTAEKVLDTAKAFADPVRYAGYNMTLRNHILLWNDERGR